MNCITIKLLFFFKKKPTQLPKVLRAPSTPGLGLGHLTASTTPSHALLLHTINYMKVPHPQAPLHTSGLCPSCLHYLECPPLVIRQTPVPL